MCKGVCARAAAAKESLASVQPPRRRRTTHTTTQHSIHAFWAPTQTAPLTPTRINKAFREESTCHKYPANCCSYWHTPPSPMSHFRENSAAYPTHDEKRAATAHDCTDQQQMTAQIVQGSINQSKHKTITFPPDLHPETNTRGGPMTRKENNT